MGQVLFATKTANKVLIKQWDVSSCCTGVVQGFGLRSGITSIPRLKVEIEVGSANNQLLDDSHGATLAQLGILYAPDYVANSGGIINGCRELLG
jgi:hypothetical protein